MIIFNSNLDNTIIYPSKTNIGEDKLMVELYKGEELSFITKKTYDSLIEVVDNVLFVPTTLRTTDEYNRVNLGIKPPKYVLTYNGGVLLINGTEYTPWYSKTLRLINSAAPELEKVIKFLKFYNEIGLEFNSMRDLFVSIKSHEPEAIIEKLEDMLDLDEVHIFTNNGKVHVIPKKLNKGDAVKRLKKYIGKGTIVTAGYNQLDISMLKVADIAIAPENLKDTLGNGDNIKYVAENQIFSDAVLEYVSTIQV